MSLTNDQQTDLVILVIVMLILMTLVRRLVLAVIHDDSKDSFRACLSCMYGVKNNDVQRDCLSCVTNSSNCSNNIRVNSQSLEKKP